MTARLKTLSLASLLLLSAPGEALGEEVISLGGAVINITVGKGGSVRMTVKSSPVAGQGAGTLTYLASGEFDNQQLFGKFQLYGRRLPTCIEADLCLQFTGELDLGGLGGWPRGTRTTFVMSLMMDRKKGKTRGVYHIGPLPSMDFLQYGTLDLAEAPAEDVVGEVCPRPVGIPECDRYIASYFRCVRDHVSGDAGEALTRALRTACTAWQAAASSQKGRTALAAACRTARDAAAKSLAAFNCDW